MNLDEGHISYVGCNPIAEITKPFDKFGVVFCICQSI